MRRRCNNEKHKRFENYGGRGIKVCKRWDKFENFLHDMGRKPRPDMTIERLDNNGDYEPQNCVWETRALQNRNKRNTIVVTYKGRKWLFTDLIKELGVSRMLVYGRLKNGWPLEAALAIPSRGYRK